MKKSEIQSAEASAAQREGLQIDKKTVLGIAAVLALVVLFVVIG